MDAISQREPRVLWSFWVACGLAVTGGILPLLLTAGGTNRLAGAAIPFGIAAMAMAAAALLYQRGRPLATSLYFVAGIALVYGMLSIIAVPLRLAVLGTCDPALGACTAGFERPLTGGEESGLAIGIAMGTLAILVGFFGLLMLFRIRPQIATPPPVRRDAAPWVPPPAAPSTPQAATQEPEPEVLPATAPLSQPTSPEAAPVDTAAANPVPPPKPTRKPRAKRAPKPPPELPPPAEPLELPAPVESLELPPHSSSTEPGSDPPSTS
jgi:hypothetical protein